MKTLGPRSPRLNRDRQPANTRRAANLSHLGLRALIALRTGALVALEPLDYAARIVNGKGRLPPLNLRRYAGPLESLETSGAEFSAYLKLLCDAKSDSAILDVGCGFGLMALYLENYLAPPGKYLGLDISRQAVRWAERHISKRAAHMQFLHLDVRNGAYNPKGQERAEDVNLPIPFESFDIVLFKSVFTHLRPPEVANYLREVARILSPEGLCLGTFFLLNDVQESFQLRGLNAVDFRFGDHNWRYAIREMPEVAVAYREQLVRDLATQAGLTLIKAHYGSWSGRADGLSYQDIVLLTRTRAS